MIMERSVARLARRLANQILHCRGPRVRSGHKGLRLDVEEGKGLRDEMIEALVEDVPNTVPAFGAPDLANIVPLVFSDRAQFRREVTGLERCEACARDVPQLQHISGRQQRRQTGPGLVVGIGSRVDGIYETRKKPVGADLDRQGVDLAEEVHVEVAVNGGLPPVVLVEQQLNVVAEHRWKCDAEMVERTLAQRLHAVLVAEAEDGEQLVLRDATRVNLEVPLPEVSDV